MEDTGAYLRESGEGGGQWSRMQKLLRGEGAAAAVVVGRDGLQRPDDGVVDAARAAEHVGVGGRVSGHGEWVLVWVRAILDGRRR